MTGKNCPEDVTADERQLAKPCNFGLLYRMGNRGFYNYLRINFVPDVTFEEACELRARFFAGYPDMARWLRTQRPVVVFWTYAGIMPTPWLSWPNRFARTR